MNEMGHILEKKAPVIKVPRRLQFCLGPPKAIFVSVYIYIYNIYIYTYTYPLYPFEFSRDMNTNGPGYFTSSNSTSNDMRGP